MLCVLPVRDGVNGSGSEHARSGDDFPCQVVAVPRVEDSTHDPGRAPLTERISHDDQRQELASRGARGLLVQDNTQEGSIDVQPAIVTNETQFPEFIHEKIDPRARCANHFR
jgi:hypothetical protein